MAAGSRLLYLCGFFQGNDEENPPPRMVCRAGSGLSVRIAKGKRQVLPCAGRRSVFGAEKSKSATQNVLRI